jgi:hypothetical protein
MGPCPNKLVLFLIIIVNSVSSISHGFGETT